MTNPGPRNLLRRELRTRRRALDGSAQMLAAQRLAAQVAGLRLFRVSRHIAVYLPNDGEIDPLPLITRIWQAGKTCYLPVLSGVCHDRLWFAPFLPDSALAVNRLGIVEPEVPADEQVRAQRLDLLLMPLVAFDSHGNRLGMGGGFYDKSLAFLLHRQAWRKPHLVGLAHDFQHVDRLENFPWDVPLQAVATDRKVYIFGDTPSLSDK